VDSAKKIFHISANENPLLALPAILNDQSTQVHCQRRKFKMKKKKNTDVDLKFKMDATVVSKI
jgi:hypothetical protein